MTGQPVLLMVGDACWSIGYMDGPNIRIDRIELPADSSAQQMVESLAAHLVGTEIVGTSQQSESGAESETENTSTKAGTSGDGGQSGGGHSGAGGGGVVLGVPSGWCLCGTVPVPNLPARQKRTAMLFALEEKLPIPVEEVVADFIPTDETALGIAVEVQRLKQLVDALEDQGIPVDAICPTALLAVQHLMSGPYPVTESVAWRDPEGLNLFEIGTSGKPRHWRWLKGADSDNSVSNTELTEFERQWLHLNLGQDNPPKLLGDAELLEMATRMAADVPSGRTEPWVNLRRDAIDISDRMRRVRGHLVAAVAAAAVLLLAVTGVCLWRAHHYRETNQQYDTAITALYHDTFGDQARPTSVKRRFETRLRELRGLRGEEVEDTADLETVSALWLLHDMLEQLPTDKRLCLLDITVGRDQLTIVGQARTHSDADLVASALRRSGRFTVEPPSTSNLKDGGVSFTLNCTAIEKKPTTPPKSSTIAEIAGITKAGKTATDGGVEP